MRVTVEQVTTLRGSWRLLVHGPLGVLWHLDFDWPLDALDQAELRHGATVTGMRTSDLVAACRQACAPDAVPATPPTRGQGPAPTNPRAADRVTGSIKTPFDKE